jgi:hypothetical protein
MDCGLSQAGAGQKHFATIDALGTALNHIAAQKTIQLDRIVTT